MVRGSHRRLNARAAAESAYFTSMRVFCDVSGSRWEVRLISHGRTSAYLNPRVHRPVLQFTCRDRTLPARYTAAPEGVEGSLDRVEEAALRRLLARARSH